MSDNVLYRFYSSVGQLLYVGITANPPARFKAHGETKLWWKQVAGITIENYDSREDLEAAERRAIQVERPMHNIIHNGVRKLHRVTADPAVQTNAISYSCNACGGSVFGKQGYIYVSLQEIEHVRMTWKAEAAERVVCPMCGKKSVYIADSDRYLHVDGTDNEDCWIAMSQGVVGEHYRVITGSDLINSPRPAKWRVYHQGCDPDPDSGDYWFDVGRADTYPKLLSWSAHLFGKNWLKYTNWSEFIYSRLTAEARAV